MFIDIRDKDSVLRLHNEYALSINTHRIRLLELETYHISDPYTHGNEKQYAYKDNGECIISPNEHSLCSFYVHRVGKKKESSYKGGTYKGIDIASNGGILIRSILHNGHIVEGPSLVVDYLCSLGDWSVEELENRLSLIRYRWYTIANIQYIGARVGLTLKNIDNIHAYVSQERSCIFIPKKEKISFFTTYNTLHRDDIKYKSNRHITEFNNGTKHIGDIIPNVSQSYAAGYLHSR